MELKEALEETAGFKRGPLNTLFQDKKQKATEDCFKFNFF